MLTYHPSLDTYHCFFRVIYFLSKFKNMDFEIDKVRIIDFYMSSPAALVCFKFPSDMRNKRKIFGKKVNEYSDSRNHKSLFFEMKHMQSAVFNMLASMGLVDSAKLKQGHICLLREKLTDDLFNIIENGSSIDKDAGDFAVESLAKFPLLGLNGLKYRSGLMDHRYDLV